MAVSKTSVGQFGVGSIDPSVSYAAPPPSPTAPVPAPAPRPTQTAPVSSVTPTTAGGSVNTAYEDLIKRVDDARRRKAEQQAADAANAAAAAAAAAANAPPPPVPVPAPSSADGPIGTTTQPLSDEDNLFPSGDLPRPVGAMGAGGEQSTARDYSGDAFSAVAYTDDADWQLGRSAGYAKGAADQFEATGDYYGNTLHNIGMQAGNFGVATGQQLYNQGQGAQASMVQGGMQAQSALSIAAQQANQNIVGAGAQGAGAIKTAAEQGQSQLYGAGTRGAMDLFGFAQDAEAQQAAAAARRAGAMDFATAARGLTGVGMTATDLAAIEASEGPSAAQAQLQAGLNAAQASNLAMARSGRGWGGSASALSQAAVANAQAGQEAANRSAMLRASEDAAFRQRQASNLDAAGRMRLGVTQQQAAQTEANSQFQLQQRALADQTALGYGQQALSGLAGSSDARLAGTTAGAQMGFAGAQSSADTYLRGTEAGNLARMQGLQSAYEVGLGALESGYNMGIGATQAGADVGLQGMQLGGQMIGAGGAMDMAGQQAGLDVWRTQAQIDQVRAGNALVEAGIANDLEIANNATMNAMGGAGIGGAAAFLALLSDRSAKTDIRPESDIKLGRNYREISPGIYDPWTPQGDEEDPQADAAFDRRAQFASSMLANSASQLGRSPFQYGHFSEMTRRPMVTSDERSKTRIAQLEDQVSVLGGDPLELDPRTARPGPMFEHVYDPHTGTAGLYRLPPTEDERPPAPRPRPGYPSAESTYDRDALDAAHVRQGGVVTDPDPYGLNYVGPAAREMLDKTPAYSFNYRDPERHGAGRQYGVMADDLEKSPAGRTVVERGPDGLKRVDTGKLTMLNTAALSNLQAEIEEMKKKKSSGKQASAPPYDPFSDVPLGYTGLF